MRLSLVVVIFLSTAFALAGACSFNLGVPPGARGGSGAGASPLGGGTEATGGFRPSGSGGFTTGEVDAGEILTRDAGTCLEQPGQDECTAVCNVESHVPDQLPPDILIVLDKSLSMADGPDNMPCRAGCVSKWTQVSQAIVSVVGSTDTTVNWGLKYFGNDNQCGVTEVVDVPVAPANHQAIADSIGAARPSSYTPTRVAMTVATSYLQKLTEPNPKFIVLATDGLPNCAPGATRLTDGDGAGAEQAVADALVAGFPTFVVGISTTTGAVATLNDMAMKGGMPRTVADPAKDPLYYPVTSTADLQAALSSIAGQVATCQYPLAAPGPDNDPSNLTVHLAGVTLARDSTDGWDYTGPDQTAIKLFGAACERVMKDPQAKVEVFYGCPGQPPVP